MTTVGDAISRVRNVLKAVKEDPFLTDRFLYSLIIKYGKLFLKREEDQQKSIKSNNALVETIPCIELIDVDKVEACCIGVRTGCTFKRSKDKLPKIMEGSNGPVIRSVTTLDQSQRLEETYPSTYANLTHSTNFKYLKAKYFWYADGYLFIPDVDWEAVRIEAIFDEDIKKFICSEDAQDCVLEQDRKLAIPDHLFAEIEQMVLKEILTAGQIPSDGADDSQNVMR
jgi:hypothetical protein